MASQSTVSAPQQQVMAGGARGFTNGTVSSSPSGRVVSTYGGGKVLCVADIRGQISSLNRLAKDTGADYIVHTGDFGFYSRASLDHISSKTLRHVVQYSPLCTSDQRRSLLGDGADETLRANILKSNDPVLSELELFLQGQVALEIPVYTVWGACEDVHIVEKFRTGEYNIPNLHVIDEHTSHMVEVGGVKLRLLGLGGAVVMHKLFDNGKGRSTIAGGEGTMWTSLLQIGELIETAHRVYDPTETRVLVSHGSPGREGLLAQLALSLRADLTISAGLHFRYASSYNDFSVVANHDTFKSKLAGARAQFMDVWETVRAEVEPAVANNETQKRLLELAVGVIQKMPANAGLPGGDEAAFKNLWNFNLCDAAFGWILLDISDGRVSAEIRSQGFNFGYRRTAQQPSQAKVAQKSSQSQPPPSSQGRTAAAAQRVPAPSSTPGDPPAAEVASPATPTGEQRRPVDRLPGLWVDAKDPSVDAETVVTYFATEDQPRIVKKEKKVAKSSKVYFLIYFSTREEANAAMERIDREKVLKVNESESSVGRRPPFPREREGSWRGAPTEERARSSGSYAGGSSYRGGSGFRGRGGYGRGRGGRGARGFSDADGGASADAGGAPLQEGGAGSSANDATASAAPVSESHPAPAEPRAAAPPSD